ncbi:SigE family RNA polymerase sigma factor [Actinoplanes sp. NPDC049118]|uniref:SigE family RNA polymerase sigma factor n=1 Tax=Actinoplanes sp. NPDC049118 TaxID=3155769 RepID=UPI0033F3B2A1
MSQGFDAFVVARGHALRRFAHVLCGDPHLAEDLVQEVLARAHRRWERIEAMDLPEAYVRKAVVREYLSWRRRRSSTERAMAELPDRPQPPGPGHDPAHDLAARDEMWALLAGLPRAQRAVLVLRFYLDMTDEEIANTLGCAHPTVRAHASRALGRLRAAMADRSAPQTVEVSVERR